MRWAMCDAAARVPSSLRRSKANFSGAESVIQTMKVPSLNARREAAVENAGDLTRALRRYRTGTAKRIGEGPRPVDQDPSHLQLANPRQAIGLDPADGAVDRDARGCREAEADDLHLTHHVANEQGAILAADEQPPAHDPRPAALIYGVDHRHALRADGEVIDRGARAGDATLVEQAHVRAGEQGVEAAGGLLPRGPPPPPVLATRVGRECLHQHREPSPPAE